MQKHRNMSIFILQHVILMFKEEEKMPSLFKVFFLCRHHYFPFMDATSTSRVKIYTIERDR